jgi:hypothetical protein
MAFPTEWQVNPLAGKLGARVYGTASTVMGRRLDKYSLCAGRSDDSLTTTYANNGEQGQEIVAPMPLEFGIFGA